MKFECLSERLLNALNKGYKIASKNLTLPVLQCFLITAKDNSINIKSTNLNLGFEMVVPAKVIKEGVAAVPAQLLTSYISAISSEKSVICELDGGVMKVLTSKGSSSIKTLPYEDFPLLPPTEKDNGFEIDSKDLLSGLKSTVWSSSNTSIKPELNSVFVHFPPGGVCFAATDSFRLAEKTISMKIKSGIQSFLIPSGNTLDIIRIFEGVEDKIKVFVSKNQISFIAGNIYVVSRNIDGNFPDYKRLIPKESLTEALLLKQDLINVLRITQIFSDKANQLEFIVEPKKKRLSVRAGNLQDGETAEEVKGTVGGEDVDAKFSQRYIADCLSSISSDSVVLSFNGPEKPLKISGAGDSSFAYIVMPMSR
ncbi:MAG: DNA polymerase III subunit beta [Patescibacteria group bacterium]